MTKNWKLWACIAWLWLAPLTVKALTPVISTGYSNSVFMHSDGSVWSVGWNPVAAGTTGTPSPVRVFQLPNTVFATYGANAVFAILADGTLWGAGCNSHGQLGTGVSQLRCGLPAQPVPGLAGVKAIAASPNATSNHVLVLKQDGTVWSWGGNSNGQLGDGTKNSRFTPGQVSGLTNIVSVAAGNLTSLALGADGTVWVWGNTCCGAAGNGRRGNEEHDPEWNHLVPTQVQNLDQVIAITAGAWQHMALRANGTVWIWGNGALGTGSTREALLPVQISSLDNVVAISVTGYLYSVALKADGTVWTFGSNSQGQLGVAGITYSNTPVQVPGVSDAVAISAGWNHVVAMRRDGTILAWGSNQDGQLGDGTLQNRADPRPVVGPGGSGRLNLLETTPGSINQLPQAQVSLNVSSGRAPLTVQADGRGSIDPDGAIRAYLWTTSDGQQATGSSATFAFVQAGTYNVNLVVEDNSSGRGTARQQVTVLPSATVAAATPMIRISDQSSLALANDGRVFAWGAGWKIGLFDAQASSALPRRNSLPIVNGITGALDISVGGAAHALLSDGTVLGWGINDTGQVGADSQTNQFAQPQRLPNLPPTTALAAGWRHSVALTRDGRVFAWGMNTNGQLGLGDNENRFQPAEIAGLANVIAIAAGSNSFSAALRNDGTVWAWGANQLGDGTTASQNRPMQIAGLASIAKIFATSNALFAQEASGVTWVMGYLPISIQGDPGPRAGPRRVSVFDGATQIAGSSRHILVLKADGTVWTAGQVGSQALGIATSGDVANLQQIPDITDAIAVAAADSYPGASSIVLRRDGTLLAWGRNSYGEAGNGTLAPQQIPALVLNETGTNALDLIPEGSNSISRDMIPQLLVATYASGDSRATTLYVDVRGRVADGTFASAYERGRFAGIYNVYVAANVPTSTAAPYFELDSGYNWRVLTFPMVEFMRGVSLENQDSVVRAQVLQSADLTSPLLEGTSIFLGYGTDSDEMVRNGRYRTIFTVTQQ